MRSRSIALGLPAVMLCGMLLCGCGGNANDEGVGGTAKVAPRKEGTPDFKSYGELQSYQAEQARKKGKDKAAAPEAPDPKKEAEATKEPADAKKAP